MLPMAEERWKKNLKVFISMLKNLKRRNESKQMPIMLDRRQIATFRSIRESMTPRVWLPRSMALFGSCSPRSPGMVPLKQETDLFCSPMTFGSSILWKSWISFFFAQSYGPLYFICPLKTPSPMISPDSLRWITKRHQGCHCWTLQQEPHTKKEINIVITIQLVSQFAKEQSRLFKLPNRRSTMHTQGGHIHTQFLQDWITAKLISFQVWNLKAAARSHDWRFRFDAFRNSRRSHDRHTLWLTRGARWCLAAVWAAIIHQRLVAWQPCCLVATDCNLFPFIQEEREEREENYADQAAIIQFFFRPSHAIAFIFSRLCLFFQDSVNALDTISSTGNDDLHFGFQFVVLHTTWSLTNFFWLKKSEELWASSHRFLHFLKKKKRSRAGCTLVTRLFFGQEPLKNNILSSLLSFWAGNHNRWARWADPNREVMSLMQY